MADAGVIESLVGGLLAGYGIAIPVGAIAVLIVGTGMRCGFLCGASAGAGAATADLIYATVAVTVGTAVARWLEPWSSPIRVGSALVLVAIALWGLAGARRGLQSATTEVVISRGELATTYARFVGLTVINPLTVVYFTTMVLGNSMGRPQGVGAALVFAVGAFAASLSWQLLLAALGAFGRKGLSPRARVAALVIGNLLILSLALRMVLN